MGMDEPEWVGRLVCPVVLRLVGSKVVTALGLSCSFTFVYTI